MIRTMLDAEETLVANDDFIIPEGNSYTTHWPRGTLGGHIVS